MYWWRMTAYLLFAVLVGVLLSGLQYTYCLCDVPRMKKVRGKPYKIERLLASGHSSSIYAVLPVCHSGKGKEVWVLKKYHTSNSMEFEREKEVLKALDHRNTVRPVLFGRHRKLLMEFLEVSLRDLISSKQISDMEHRDFSLQILRGLEYLHSMNIVHFDLKPENIMVHHKTVKIIDFGSAKYNNEKIVVCNWTPAYTALEYMIGLQTAHFFKDIWSYGCILYEMAAFKQLITSTGALGMPLEILETFGSPSTDAYAGLEIKNLNFLNIFGHQGMHWSSKMARVPTGLHPVLLDALRIDPRRRATASDLYHMIDSHTV